VSYRSKGETTCPICAGTDLSWKRPWYDKEAMAFVRPMECENCGATWDALYRFDGHTEPVETQGGVL
jgi:hypothetical protein